LIHQSIAEQDLAKDGKNINAGPGCEVLGPMAHLAGHLNSVGLRQAHGWKVLRSTTHRQGKSFGEDNTVPLQLEQALRMTKRGCRNEARPHPVICSVMVLRGPRSIGAGIKAKGKAGGGRDLWKGKPRSGDGGCPREWLACTKETQLRRETKKSSAQ